ncbi:MAG TPA: FAD-dependent oxidoreductase, partial [Pyrinomonadaceae bacterium]|nr:FAD-dependent oxidoreductase [Pyrinomonadaceae bacterium]
GFVGLENLLTAPANDGRVYFAGEHLSPLFSWIQGALSSALKAVQDIDEMPVVGSVGLTADETHRA